MPLKIDKEVNKTIGYLDYTVLEELKKLVLLGASVKQVYSKIAELEIRSLEIAENIHLQSTQVYPQ